MREVVFFLSAALWLYGADRKPVTPAAAAEYRRPAGVDPIWSPDSKSFAYRDGQAIRIYDATSRQSRELLTLKSLTDRSVTKNPKFSDPFEQPPPSSGPG